MQRYFAVCGQEGGPVQVRVSVCVAGGRTGSYAAVPALSYTLYAIQVVGGGVVERRFTDFHRLWGMLAQFYPAQVLPPIPQKKFIGRAV